MDYLSYTEMDILERVDEYSLYCHYLKYRVAIGRVYEVPPGLRASNNLTHDDHPSFSVFARKKEGNYSTVDFLWKDHGGRGYCGDIFELVKRMFGLDNREQAVQRIASEFGFGAPWSGEQKELITVPRKEKQYVIDIAVKSRPWKTRELLFYDRGNISKRILTKYDMSCVEAYWLYAGQRKPFFPESMMFAYWVSGRYQLYCPYLESPHKFKNDWNELCVPGFKQLRHESDTCIITKSLKDVACIDSFGYESISPRGENILLPPECIAYLKRHYKNIYILFDNDGKHKGDEYEFPNIFVPKILDTDKDPFDYCDNHGATETRKMLKSIIHG